MKVVVLVAAVAATACCVGVSAEEMNTATESNNRIVGGTTVTDRSKWQFLASMRKTQAGRADFSFCGGSLIAPNWVLTAAHCVSDGGTTINNVPDILVLNDLRVSATDNLQVTARPKRVVSQAGYNAPSSRNDFALIELATPVLNIKPVPLALQSPATGTTVEVAGFGTIASDGPASDALREVAVQVTSDQACRTAYSNYDTTSMICAAVNGGGKDSCQGDSGGPLIQNGVLVGVVSFGAGCAQANFPGVYARVSNAGMRSFIESTTGGKIDGQGRLTGTLAGEVNPPAVNPPAVNPPAVNPPAPGGANEAPAVEAGKGSNTAVIIGAGAGVLLIGGVLASRRSGGSSAPSRTSSPPPMAVAVPIGGYGQQHGYPQKWPSSSQGRSQQMQPSRGGYSVQPYGGMSVQSNNRRY